VVLKLVKKEIFAMKKLYLLIMLVCSISVAAAQEELDMNNQPDNRSERAIKSIHEKTNDYNAANPEKNQGDSQLEPVTDIKHHQLPQEDSQPQNVSEFIHEK
jgi:hypothetical protein